MPLSDVALFTVLMIWPTIAVIMCDPASLPANVLIFIGDLAMIVVPSPVREWNCWAAVAVAIAVVGTTGWPLAGTLVTKTICVALVNFV